jgi:hypothetical protein
MMNPVTVNDIKTAMRDPSFIATLPPSLTPEVQKFMSNPGCGCNMSVYQKILKEAPAQIQAYFPTKSVAEGAAEVDRIMANQPQIQNMQQQQLCLNIQMPICQIRNNKYSKKKRYTFQNQLMTSM